MELVDNSEFALGSDKFGLDPLIADSENVIAKLYALVDDAARREVRKRGQACL